MFNPYKFISNKKNGISHTPNQITQFITGLLNKDYDPTQMAAWLMAVCFKGINQNELIEYVKCIINAKLTNNPHYTILLSIKLLHKAKLVPQKILGEIGGNHNIP